MFSSFIQAFQTWRRVSRVTKILIAKAPRRINLYPNEQATNRVVTSECRPMRIEMAQTVANLLVKEAAKAKLDLAYVLAEAYCRCGFDPHAINRHLFQTQGVETFDTTSWGFAQQTGKEYRAREEFHGLSEAEILARVTNPYWSIPYYIQFVLPPSASLDKLSPTLQVLPEFIALLS